MRGVSSLWRVLRLGRARWFGATRPRLSVGTGTQVKGRLIVRGPGTVVIGDRCRIGMGARAGVLKVSGSGRVVIGDECIIDAAEIHTLNPDATITIGAGCYLNRVEMAASTTITVGQRCEIGSALIYDTDFHSLRRAPRGDVRSGPITIGDDAWIAARTAILRGVTVGDRAVIGLGVTVSKDVGPDALLRTAEPRIDRL